MFSNFQNLKIPGYLMAKYSNGPITDLYFKCLPAFEFDFRLDLMT